MMKKLLFTFATGAFLATGAVAQTNLDLETWTGIECDGWLSLNSYTGLGAPQTLYQETTDVGEGASSARIVTGYWLGATAFGAPSDTVGGFLSMGVTGGDLTAGIPYTDKPTSVDFMMKSDLETGDTGVVFVQLTRWDTASNMTMVVAQSVVLGVDSGAWAAATAGLFYFDTINSPDSLQIICVSSIGTLFGAPLPIIGSSISVDGFVINVPVGIDERDENVKFSVYPNPASGHVVIKNGSSRSDMDVEMIDINGKLVRSYTDVAGGEMTIDGNGLARGSYFVKVPSGGKQVIKQVIFQ